VEKRTYRASTMYRVLGEFERGYSISSSEFFSQHQVDGTAVQHIPSVHRQAWAAFYETWLRMSDSSFAARVERELEYA
jgi:hypothetical protein